MIQSHRKVRLHHYLDRILRRISENEHEHQRHLLRNLRQHLHPHHQIVFQQKKTIKHIYY